MKVNGVWRYVYRAVDQDGQVIDALVSIRRDANAARRFFRRALAVLKVAPVEVLSDAAAVYPRVLDELVFRQNLRRGHYELAVHLPAPLRIAAAFTELARAI